MKKIITLMVILIAISVATPSFGQTPEDEKIAKSLYLKASKAIRDGDMSEAVRLLTQILDEYSESEVALQADEKLSEISDEAKIADLPKTPGFYWVERSGKITEMATRDIKKGAPYELSTVYATFAQEEIPEIFADELEKFIVYRPKGTLQDVYWTSFFPLINVDANGNKTLSGNNKMFKDWEVPSVDGDPFGSSLVVFEEIKPGMWEVGFPTIFSPAEPVMCGLIDGSGQVGLVTVQSKMVHSFYPFLEFWKKAEIDLASTNYISKQLEKYPDNPDLHFFDAILHYKTAYKNDQPQTDALEIARKAQELSKTNEVTPKVVTDLNVLIEYCIADSIVRANTILASDSPDVKAEKHAALKSYVPDKVPADMFWIQKQLTRNHACVGEFDEAILIADKAIDTFKKKKPNTGISILGLNVKAEISIGKPGKPEAFNIHDALTCYTLEPEWVNIKELKDEMESAKWLDQAIKLINSGGEDKDIEKALKEAKGKDKNNIDCYKAMAGYYNKIGKPKDAEKAEKDIEKAKKRLSELAFERKSS